MTLLEAQTTSSSRRTRQSPKTPSELLIQLHQRFPAESKKEAQQRFINRALEDDEIITAALRDWYSLNYRRLTVRRPEEEEIRKPRKDKTAEIKNEIIGNMLNFVMPTGKTLADTTGRECIRAGGIFVRIGKKVGPGKLVGKVLTNQQLMKLFAK